MVPTASTWMLTWRRGNSRSRGFRRTVRSLRGRDRLAGEQAVARGRQCRVRGQRTQDMEAARPGVQSTCELKTRKERRNSTGGAKLPDPKTLRTPCTVSPYDKVVL